MVWKSLVNLVGLGEPTLPDGPIRLPEYFPVEPKGCERVSQKLFACIANEATAKARDIEKMGYHKSHYPDVVITPTKLPIFEEAEKEGDTAAVAAAADLPKPGDNPLDACRSSIAYYRKCCDRELKKKKNWILTEPYRVQEEYRYQQQQQPQKQ